MPRPLGDLGYAFVGWFLLAVAPVAFLLGSVAPPAAVAHRYAGRPVGPLGATHLLAVTLTVGVGLPVYFLSRLTGGDGWLGSPAVRLVGLRVVYAVAFAPAVRRRPVRRGPSA